MVSENAKQTPSTNNETGVEKRKQTQHRKLGPEAEQLTQYNKTTQGPPI